MKVLIFSDIHSDFGTLKQLISTPADIYIAAGDLVNWTKGLPECGELLKPLGDRLWVMPGNHETDRQIQKLCDDFGFRNFHEQTFEAGDCHFAGLGYSNPTPFNTPGEYSEEEIAGKLERFSGLSPLVLVCHAPPHNTALDETGSGFHAGSQAVRDFVDKHSPQHFFCGHIHEAAGKSEKIGSTQARNVGKQGYLLEL